MWRLIGTTIAAVMLGLSACSQAPTLPPPGIQDKIDRDARLDGTWQTL
jgi:hypothetical protein